MYALAIHKSKLRCKLIYIYYFARVGDPNFTLYCFQDSEDPWQASCSYKPQFPDCTTQAPSTTRE